VVPAREEHLPAILEIYNEAVLHGTATFDTEPKSLEDRRQWLAGHGEAHPVVVAVEEGSGEVLAWGSLSPYSDRLAYRFTVEDSVYVRTDRRGEGLGGLILGRLLELAAALGYRAVVAKIVDGNAPSLALHRRAGFFDVGTLREVGFKFDRWLDVTLLQALLR
jgi:phosphinothricin acetyltransferase